eukprot:2926716-Prymnesium_polylepis.1
MCIRDSGEGGPRRGASGTPRTAFAGCSSAAGMERSIILPVVVAVTYPSFGRMADGRWPMLSPEA